MSTPTAELVWIDGEDKPRGLCWCGCGQATDISAKNLARRGDYKGVPNKCATGHNIATSLSTILVELSNGDPDKCWVWTGPTVGEYGAVRGTTAHRVNYERLVGPIPPGLELDHLCRNPPCVNPRHLEPVTHAENVRRHYADYTHCKHGHELTDENTYRDPRGSRECRTCRRARRKAWVAS